MFCQWRQFFFGPLEIEHPTKIPSQDVDYFEASAYAAELFNKNRNLHKYPTRSAGADDLYLDHSRLNIQPNSLSIIELLVWKSVPTTVSSFNKSVLTTDPSRFINSMVYYGVSLSSPSLGGNIYLNFFLTSVIEIPANYAAIWCMNKYSSPFCWDAFPLAKVCGSFEILEIFLGQMELFLPSVKFVIFLFFSKFFPRMLTITIRFLTFTIASHCKFKDLFKLVLMLG